MGITKNAVVHMQISFNEVMVAKQGVTSEMVLYSVPAEKKVKVTELTVRGTEIGVNWVIQLRIAGGGAVKLSFDGNANKSREWESEAGRLFTAGQGIAVRAWGVYGTTIVYGALGYTLYVSGSGYEWTV